jgi:hypothetical protein
MSEITKTYETKSGFQIEIETFFGDSEIWIRVELWSPADKNGETRNLYRKGIRSKHLTDGWQEMQNIENDMIKIMRELNYSGNSIDPVVEACRLTRNGKDEDEYGDPEHYRMMTNCINYLLNKKE